MAESWCKVASDLDSHPKIRRAGRLGREVFLFALRRNAGPGNMRPGYIDALELEPWYVADQLMMTEAEAVTGVTACVTAALLARDGEKFAIIGWEERWGKSAKGNAERQAKFRAKKRNDKKKLIETETSNDRNVTSNEESRESHLDQRRGDETRSSPESLAPARTHAIPQCTEYDNENLRARGELAERIWKTISDARVSVAGELGLSAQRFAVISPASLPRGFRDLQQRIREEGNDAPAVCTRVCEALISQAREKRSIEWLSEKVFAEGAWITAKESIPGWRGVPRATHSRDRGALAVAEDFIERARAEEKAS